jgi:hypothetical protein
MVPYSDQYLKETSAVEEAIPAHMLFLMSVEVQKKGYEFRSDMRDKLNNAAAVPLVGLDPLSIARVAKRIDEVSRQLLHELSPDDPLHGFYACAMFSVTLIDEGLLADPHKVAPLVSLVLLDDLKSEGPGAVYSYNEAHLKTEAKKLIHEAKKLGLYKMSLMAPLVGKT